MNFNYAKYKGIIFGITLFLILEVSILTTNFFLSFDIAKDAEAVNIAGRQRMLSQRITKSLLDTQVSIYKATNNSIQELKSSTQLFDSTINAFNSGGDITGAAGKKITIQPVTSELSIAAVSEGLIIWTQYKILINEAITAISNNESYKINSLNAAISFGRENNLQLLKLMNDLTVDLEGVASSKAFTLQLIQTIGIILGGMTFFIIIFYSLRQLQRNDATILEKQKENERILETVDEGLFLVDSELNIGDQQSNKILDIFSREDTKGKHLLDFLGNFVSSKDRDTTKEYFDLLFDNRKPERLIGDLNPLREIAIQVPDGNLGFQKKSLKFAFKRVKENNEIKRILTTISDISTEVKLKEELAKSEKANLDQMNILSIIINSNQASIANFIINAQENYEHMNSVLKEETQDYTDFKAKIQKLITSMHRTKGDASALSIELITGLAHEFETIAQELNNQPKVCGEDFVPLTIILEKMMSYNEALSGLYKKIYGNKDKAISVPSSATDDIKTRWENLYSLSNKIASRKNKPIEFIASGLNDFPLPEKLRQYINTVAIQLIRNSIDHGIETKEERISFGKDEQGLISLNLIKFNDDSFELSFQDDGNGIHQDRLVQRAIEANIITQEKAALLSPKKILSLLFHPGLSTSETIDEDSGRGVGMFLVLEETNAIGGKISIQTAKGVGTTFKIKIPAMKTTQSDTPVSTPSSAAVA